MKRFMIKRVDKRLQAVQCLTGNKIKIIACITMLIDHFSKIFLESIMNDKLFPLYLAGGMSTEQFYGIDPGGNGADEGAVYEGVYEAGAQAAGLYRRWPETD